MPASKDFPGAAGSTPASNRTRAACASTQGVTAPSSAAPAGRTQVRTRAPNTLAVRQLLGITTSHRQIAPHRLCGPLGHLAQELGAQAFGAQESGARKTEPSRARPRNSGQSYAI